jgi:hypothetical protein
MTTPLFPTRAKGMHLSPYTYDMLGKLGSAAGDVMGVQRQ